MENLGPCHNSENVQIGKLKFLRITYSFDKALVSCATAPLDAAYAGTVRPPWNESRLAKLMMLPRRPVEGEGESVSMCAPTSRQRANTVLRFTWITWQINIATNSKYVAWVLPRSNHCQEMLSWGAVAGFQRS
jgi:hypothetical protein